MLIKDVPNILALLKKVLKEIENKDCDETIFKTMNGELIILIDIPIIESKGMLVRISSCDGYYLINISFDGKPVNISTENEEINKLLKDIQEKFMEKCKKIK